MLVLFSAFFVHASSFLDRCVIILQSRSFIATVTMATLSQRKPAFAGWSHDSNKRNYTVLSFDLGIISLYLFHCLWFCKSFLMSHRGMVLPLYLSLLPDKFGLCFRLLRVLIMKWFFYNVILRTACLFLQSARVYIYVMVMWKISMDPIIPLCFPTTSIFPSIPFQSSSQSVQRNVGSDKSSDNLC
jgi:hypothetical protein